MASCYTAAGMWAEALEVYEKLVAMSAYNQNPVLYCFQGLAVEKLDRPGDALEAYRRSLELLNQLGSGGDSNLGRDIRLRCENGIKRLDDEKKPIASLKDWWNG
ncbi:MAG: hypothetical protein ACTSUE_24460 [Promethearchaeota archaeon]